nr:B3 domain-containing transcription factor FUS3-like [Ipomoea trifida]
MTTLHCNGDQWDQDIRHWIPQDLDFSLTRSLRTVMLKPAEDYLPKLLVKEGFPISMEDMDGLHVWHFKFRYWPNNSSRMYVLENTGGFVHEHSLGLGDYVAFYIDEQKQNYVIEARKAGDRGACKAAEVLTDYGQNDDVEGGVIQNQGDASCYYPHQSFPRVDDMETTSFVYDTTFSNESSPFDFMGAQSLTTRLLIHGRASDPLRVCLLMISIRPRSSIRRKYKTFCNLKYYVLQ